MKRFFLISFMFFFGACNYTIEKKQRSNETPPQTPQSPEPKEPLAFTYAKLSSDIFSKHCFRCHSGAKPKANFDLSNYKAVMESGNVAVNDPDNSNLYQLVQTEEMPPKPNAALTKDEKDFIYQWIKKGCIEK